jgi:hypothetical protein
MCIRRPIVYNGLAESVPGADKPYADKELIPEGFIAGKILVRNLPWTMF